MSDRLAWLGDLAPYLPPSLLGSAIGLRWAKDQTPIQKVIGFATSTALAVYSAPGIAEFFNLGPKATVLIAILTAVVGMDVLGGIVAAARQFKAAPVASFKDWWSAFRGGRREEGESIVPPKVEPHEP